jgi:AcrR family transcriptional regulator
MPRLIEPESRTDTIVDAMNYLLARDGPGGLTLRAIARESRVSTSSLLHHFGDREHLVRAAARRTGRARVQALERRADREGVIAFLPAIDDAEDLLTARAWLAWCELWRVQDSLVPTIERIRDQELMILARVLGVRIGSQDLTGVVAVIDGLNVAVCAPVRPLSPARAADILTAHVDTFAARPTE